MVMQVLTQMLFRQVCEIFRLQYEQSQTQQYHAGQAMYRQGSSLTSKLINKRTHLVHITHLCTFSPASLTTHNFHTELTVSIWLMSYSYSQRRVPSASGALRSERRSKHLQDHWRAYLSDSVSRAWALLLCSGCTAQAANTTR